MQKKRSDTKPEKRKSLSEIVWDVVGFIEIPATLICYPVAQAKDNFFYCYHLPNGQYNINGTIFMDYTKSAGLENKNTVLYAHNMNNGAIFQNLVGYKDQRFITSIPRRITSRRTEKNMKFNLLTD